MEYEWRNLTEAGKATMPAMTSAPWNGMRIPNGRLLLVGDQGYGDTIQFARYIPMVAERCQEVILGCSAEMGPLLPNIPGRQTILPSLDRRAGPRRALPAVQPAVSVPHPAGYDPGADAVPEGRSGAHRTSGATGWTPTLPAGVKRIGLAWTGRPTHPNDRRRSMPLSALAAVGRGRARRLRLAAEADAGARPGDDAAVPGHDRSVGDLTDFGETAALIENLDLVVTVDTSMGHLAGALGKPVWILIPKAADWRWMLDREDSPWYPTVRLFRQQKPGAWDEPLDRLRAALREQLAGSLAESVAGD